MSRALNFLLIIVAWNVATPAAAYIDPNVGGQIYQQFYPLLAIILGLIAFMRRWVVVILGQIIAKVKYIIDLN